ncbi:hypothetical protein K1719_039328 [Acacia pycnantha]|nr:hypothetical protein K1719_039328 [Acacia pycnantha]
MENLQRVEVRGSQGRGLDGYGGGLPQVIPVQTQHRSESQELREQLKEQITRMEKLNEQKTRIEKLKEQKTLKEKLKEQQTLIDTLLAERQERQEGQVKRQLELCHLIESNLDELRRSINFNSNNASHDEISHKNPTQKRKLHEDNYQGRV